MRNKAFRLQLLVLATLLLAGAMTGAGCIVVEAPHEGWSGMPGEGWCCKDGEVFPCPEDECYNVGGVFFPMEEEEEAHLYCQGQMQGQIPGEGWCCDAGNVLPCSEAECLSWGGVFFLHEREAIAHCQGTTPGPSPGPAPAGSPVINFFTANPSTTSAGQTSTLKWDTSGATSVTLSHGIGKMSGAGNTLVSPTGNTLYTLTATNSAGTVTATATVTVTGSAPPGGLPVINYLTANPPSISPGQPVTLSWQVTNVAIPYAILLTAPGFTSAGKGLVAVDQLQVFPTSTTTYTLAISKPAGTVTATATVTVTGTGPGAPQVIPKPVIKKFTVNPSTIAVTVGSAKLEWNVSGATAITIAESAVFPGSGNAKILPTNVKATGVWTLSSSKVGYYTYTLSATNLAGTVTDTVKLTVTP